MPIKNEVMMSMEGVQMKSYKRIAIFGPPGAGKTTLSLKLSQQLSLPCYHLDKYFFEEAWVERDKEEFRIILNTLVEQEQWIIDGNAISSLESRFARADLIIYYAPSRLRCIFGVLKRTYFDRRSHIDDRAPNCPERLTWQLFKYMWKFHARIVPIINGLCEKYPSAQIITIKNHFNTAFSFNSEFLHRSYEYILIVIAPTACIFKIVSIFEVLSPIWLLPEVFLAEDKMFCS